MLKQHILSALLICGICAPAAMAQGAGQFTVNGQAPTAGNVVGGILNTILPSNNNAGGLHNGLPATSMDSFVDKAGPMADMIYGDEGVDDIPPFFEFDKTHRINRGIFERRNAGLTTGHGAYLPDAWGGDEWVKGPEFDMSGATNSGGGTQQGGLNIGIPGVGNVNIGGNGGGASFQGNGGVNVGVGPNGGVSGNVGSFGVGQQRGSGF
ncbi:MAG: hypothetical protein ACRD3W_05085 [Terriglobales bacterium]